MDKRTKRLAIIAGIVALLAAGFYAYKFYIKEKPARPSVAITMGEHKKTSAAKPASAASTVSSAPLTVRATSEQTVIKVVENGKEIQYKNADDFVANTKLTTGEAAELGRKNLGIVKKALEDAKKRNDRNSSDRLEVEARIYERIETLIAAKMSAGQGKKEIAFAVVNKRDPFMNPLEVPKVYPPIPVAAPPYQQVPIEKITLRAIAWNKKGYRAMILTPDGRAYTLKLGDGLGDKLGKITKVNDRQLTVTEQIKDILGNVETKVTVLNLHKEAE